MTQESLYRVARQRMVENQIVSRKISDERVLAAMRDVPRHLFVEEALQGRAYDDYALPIGEGQTLSQPYIVALMSESLRLTGVEKVLEIGTGSGYQTAILSRLAARVLSIERIARLVSRAWKMLETLHCQNVVIREADGTYGWKEESPFDAILVAAGSPDVPVPLVEQLKVGGRMIIPVGSREAQALCLIVKEAEGVTTQSLIPCMFVPLLGAFGWE